MGLPKIFVPIGAKIDEFEKAMGAVSKRLNAIDREAERAFSGFDKIGERLNSIGTGLTATISAPLAVIGGAALKAGSDFEEASNRIKAFGEVGGEDLKKLQQQAIELGKDTKFSAVEAAEGMAVLANAGFKTNEVFDSIAGTLDLAAASQMSVADAAKITKDTLDQFGLSAKEATRVADILATASVDSSASMQELGSTLTYVGPIARELGLSLEETVSAIVALDKGGIRGERAGTGLRGAIASLIDPSKEAAKVINDLGVKLLDSDQKFIGLAGATLQFQAGLAKLPNDVARSQALVKIFGREAETAASILIKNGGPALDQFALKLANSDGKAKEVAKTLNSGLKGAMEELRGSVETAAIALAQSLLPAATSISKSVQGFVNTAIIPAIQAISELPKPVQTAIAGFIGFAAVIGPAILILGQFAFAISSLGPALTAMAGFMTLGGAEALKLGGRLAGLAPTLIAISRQALIAFAEFPSKIPSIITLVTALGSSLARIPVVIAGIATSAATGFTGLLASMQAVATAAKVQLIASLSALTTAITNIQFALATGLVGALSTAELALLGLAHVAAIAAAAFVGWKLGEWAYEQIPAVKALSDSINGLLDSVPGVKRAFDFLSGATSITAKSQEDLAASTAKLEGFLRSKGITIDRGKLSLEQYAAALTKAGREANIFNVELSKKERIEAYKKQITESTRQAQEYAEAHRQLGLSTAGAGQSISALEKHFRDLEKAAQKANLEYKQAIEQYDAGKISITKLAAAHQKLIDTQEAADPERRIEQQKREAEEISRVSEANVQLAEQFKRVAVEAEASANSVQNTMNRALKEIHEEAAKPITITVSLDDRLPEAVRGAIRQAEELREAYRTVGINMENTSDRIVEAYETIRESGTATPRQVLIAERAALEATVREHQAAGREVSQADIRRIEEIKQATEIGLSEQTKSTKRWAQQVSTIVNDLARDLARGTIDLFKGLLGLDGFNAKLKADSDALRRELAERTEAIEQFRTDTEGKVAEVTGRYAEQLARETGQLREALAQRESEYETFAAQVAERLEHIRITEAQRLEEEINTLSDGLRDKEAEYVKYVEDVARKEQEIRDSHSERLAEELRDLRENLRDRQQSYDDFVADANRSLQRVGADLQESIDDDTRSSNRKIEDENEDFARDQQRLNEDILKAQKKGDKEQVAALKRQLAERTSDHEKALKRIREDLAEQIDDAKKRAADQTNDLKTNLERRTRDHREYIEENIRAQEEATEKHAKEQARQLADLQRALDERTAAIIQHRIDTAEDIEGARTRSEARYRQEEADLLGSLNERKKALEEFRTETASKIDSITQLYKQKQDEEIAALQFSFSEKLKEYDAFRVEVEKKLGQLENAHKGPLDRIKELFGSVFESAAQAILRVASEEVIGSLTEKLVHLADVVFPSLTNAVRNWLRDAEGIGNAANTIKPPATTPPPGGAGGGGGGGGALGVIDAITGAITAAASVVSAIYNVRIEGTLNAIEENTRRAQIVLIDTINLANRYWPHIEAQHRYIVDVITAVLREIRNGIKTLFSVTVNLTDEQQGQLVANLIERAGSFDTIASDRLLDIFGRLGDTNVAIEGSRRSIVETMTRSTTELGGRLAAIENKLPSTAERLISGALGAVGGIAGIIPNAIAGLIGGLLGRGSGKTDDLIEENTRFTAIALLGQNGVVDRLNTFLPGIKDIHGFLYEHLAPWMAAIQFWTEENRLGDLRGDGLKFNFRILLDGRELGSAVVERDEALGGAV